MSSENLDKYEERFHKISECLSLYKNLSCVLENKTIYLSKNGSFISKIFIQEGFIEVKEFHSYDLSRYSKDTKIKDIRNQLSVFFNLNKNINFDMDLIRELIVYLKTSFKEILSVSTNNFYSNFYLHNPYLSKEKFSYKLKLNFNYNSIYFNLVKNFIIDDINNKIIPCPVLKLELPGNNFILIFLNCIDKHFYMTKLYPDKENYNSIFTISTMKNNLTLVSNQEIRDFVFNYLLKTIYNLEPNSNFEDGLSIIKILNL